MKNIIIKPSVYVKSRKVIYKIILGGPIFFKISLLYSCELSLDFQIRKRHAERSQETPEQTKNESSGFTQAKRTRTNPEQQYEKQLKESVNKTDPGQD